ncbi:uncharacterized protein LOC129745697 [Uranotaenia lowii]|uniref:uncharacterized protein LOC129745697 n=1 Tax=Uranotaenia lowii TaxID=190385 RepID=UPI002478C78D|nr:uncharacterized protein LOC129745697 [Uranotaenia lowii]
MTSPVRSSSGAGKRRRSSTADRSLCAICLESPSKDSVHLACAHEFHKRCIDAWLERQPVCPVCRNQEQDQDEDDTETDETIDDESEMSSEYLDNSGDSSSNVSHEFVWDPTLQDHPHEYQVLRIERLDDSDEIPWDVSGESNESNGVEGSSRSSAEIYRDSFESTDSAF